MNYITNICVLLLTLSLTSGFQSQNRKASVILKSNTYPNALLTPLATYYTSQSILSLSATSEDKETSGSSSSSSGGSELLEKNRRELWQEISNLEREALRILSSASASIEEKEMKKQKAFKLLSKSVGLKKNDNFMRLAEDYTLAQEEGKTGEAEKIMSKMYETKLPPHIESLVNQQRALIAPTSTPSLATKEEVAVEEVVDMSTTYSEMTTEKMKVSIHSFYDPKESNPDAGQYMFWYKVAIYNEGAEPVQVVARMWELEKYPSLEKEILRGTGILQNQPIISPGDVFAYESKCPIKSFPPQGKRVLASMSGAFTVCRGNMGQHNFPVKVGKINFVLPESKKFDVE